MPRGDRTGPMGGGPRTGRGLGYCNENTAPGAFTGGFGYGRGRGGFGRGRGCWNPWGWGAAPYQPQYENVPEQSEEDSLRSRAEQLQNELEAIKHRLGQLQEK